MNEITIETDVGSICALEAGRRVDPLVVCLHGWSQRNGRHTWAALLQPLSGAGYHVVSVDMPGWGNSPALYDRPLEQQDARNVILAILTALNSTGNAVLMGKSWGGGLALEIALDQPQRVDRLILTAPAFSDFDRLPGLRQPVLLAWAEDDPVIPFRYAARFQSIPNIKLVTYATGGHSAAMKNADKFAPEAIAFLNESPS